MSSSHSRDPAVLPEPDPVARAHSEQVADAIRREIAGHGGRIPFSYYMQLALYAPGLGYYSAGARKFGAAGDFVTAPEISSLFGGCLARQCEAVLSSTGGDLLEFGAGSGLLAADVLADLDRTGSLPEHYYILEVSADLRERQRETLAERVPALVDRVDWLDTLPAGGFSGVMLANEVLDAMPVERFRVTETGVEMQYVVAGPDGFDTVWDAAATPVLDARLRDLAAVCELPAGYESEINIGMAPWINAVADCLTQGVIMLIDYGYTRAGYYHARHDVGTLMCHYRHRVHEDPFHLPGLQDITAHVDFTAVAEAAVGAGLLPGGYTTQANFLLGCGLDRLVAHSDPEDSARHLALMQEVKRLTLPEEMGERFKVLALTRDWPEPLAGFRLRDLTDRL